MPIMNSEGPHGSPPSYDPNDSPPSYDSPSTSHTDPYPLAVPPAMSSSIPSSFSVGAKSIPPLVAGSNVTAHLRLLGAFNTLERSVSAFPSPYADPVDTPGAVPWRIFIHQALWRFEIWLKRVVIPHGIGRGSLKHEEVPPLDVLLVWHAYLLNPCVYAEDTTRSHPELRALGGMPLERIAVQIDPSTHKLQPTTAQVKFWDYMTHIPYEPLTLSLSSLDELTVECPRCAGPPMQAAWLHKPYLDGNGYAHGTGWCQNQFNIRCENCQFKITREAIAVGRFSADIAAALMSKKVYLSGLLFNPVNCVPSSEEALHITALILQPFVNLLPTKEAIGEHLGWSFTGIEKTITEARDTTATAVHESQRRGGNRLPFERTGLPMQEGSQELYFRISAAQDRVKDIKSTWRSVGPRLSKMLASYRDNPAPFSVDLVGAVLRQTNFTWKTLALGWLDVSTPFPRLAQSISRYHNFLHLLARHHGRLFVPTLDIDLAWHTHQLSGRDYMHSTRQCVGRFVDHDDKIEEGTISDGFDNTSRLWKNTYLTPYSSCESRKQESPTTFSKVKKLARQLSSSSNISGTRPVPPPDSTTHPSEHPSVVVVGNSRIADSRAERESKQTKGRASRSDEAPFLREVYGAGVLPISAVGTVAFGDLALRGWALLGTTDPNVLDAKTVEKGQCCAGFGMPHYAWIGEGGGTAGGCVSGGCSGGGRAAASGGCGSAGCGGGGCGGCGG